MSGYARSLAMMKSHLLCAALLVGGAFTLGTASANAQDYGSYDNDVYQNAPENYEVIAPHPRPQTKFGAPSVRRSLSQEVFFDDLDLRTNRGAHILRSRVRLTARLLCRDLDERYPVTADNSPPCYRNAAENGLYQADLAIRDARSYSD
jgi:UrcA family protein